MPQREKGISLQNPLPGESSSITILCGETFRRRNTWTSSPDGDALFRPVARVSGGCHSFGAGKGLNGWGPRR